jgi:hypothetical protein
MDTVTFNFVSAVSVTSATNTLITVNEPAGFSTPVGSANQIPITVQPTTLTPTNATVGQNLETTAQVNLGARVTATTPITISSSDPTKLLFSTDPTAPGSQTIVMNVVCTPQGCGSSTQPFYVYGLASSGTVGYTATAASIGTATGLVTMTPSGIVLENPFGQVGGDFFAVSGNTPNFLNVDTVRLDSAGNFAEQQALAGGQSVSVDVTSSNRNVGTVTTPVVITGGGFNNTTQFTAVGAGATMLAVNTPPGFTSPLAGASLTATVNNPNINLNSGYTIGQNLEQQGTFFLGVPAPATGASVLLTVTSGALLLSNSATTPGSAQIIVNVPAGQFVGSFYMFGTDSIGSATISASSSGYNSATGVNSLAPSGIVVSDVFVDIDPTMGSFDINTTRASNNTSVAVSTAILDSSTFRFVAAQALAPTANGLPLQAGVIDGSPAVGTLASSATIAIGASTTALPFTPLTVGTTTITASRPQGFATPQSGRTVNVNVTQ